MEQGKCLVGSEYNWISGVAFTGAQRGQRVIEDRDISWFWYHTTDEEWFPGKLQSVIELHTSVIHRSSRVQAEFDLLNWCWRVTVQSHNTSLTHNLHIFVFKCYSVAAAVIKEPGDPAGDLSFNLVCVRKTKVQQVETLNINISSKDSAPSRLRGKFSRKSKKKCLLCSRRFFNISILLLCLPEWSKQLMFCQTELLTFRTAATRLTEPLSRSVLARLPPTHRRARRFDLNSGTSAAHYSSGAEVGTESDDTKLNLHEVTLGWNVATDGISVWIKMTPSIFFYFPTLSRLIPQSQGFGVGGDIYYQVLSDTQSRHLHPHSLWFPASLLPSFSFCLCNGRNR